MQFSPLNFLTGPVSQYVENVTTTLHFHQIGQWSCPCTINKKEFKNSYVVSNFYLIQRMVEHLKGKKRRFILSPLLKLVGLFFKGININRCVLVNNWLMTNAIYPQFKDIELKDLINELTSAYPSHYLMFRSLNKYTNNETIRILRDLGCHIFPAREVYLFDPTKKLSSKALYHFRRDARLLESGAFVVKTEKELFEEDLEQALTLYKRLYLEKFTLFSPCYTLEFLKGAIQSKMLNLRVLYVGDRAVGVIGFSIDQKEMVLPFFGYDQKHHLNRDIYRLLTHIAIKIAMEKGVILNDGTGGDQAKKNRGMVLKKEYAAIYSAHLNFPYRTFWKLAGMFIVE